MTVSAHDVARELRSRLPDAGDVKIHKLLYYCQGWHLARFAEPLFAEGVEAWANGPVVAELWRDEKNNVAASRAAQQLDESALLTIELVISRYGSLTGRELISLTHDEQPWRVVSDRDDPWDDQSISTALLSEFFRSIDEIYSLTPFRMTPARRKILDEAKARSS